jgi:two-component system KDP operon response regulator KdpE
MRPLAGNKTFRKSTPESPNPRDVLIAANGVLQRPLLNSLSAAGFRLEEVNGLAHAIAALKTRRFDLLLLNLGQPEDNRESCQRIRTADANVGVVMLRTGGAPEDEVIALEAGADDCISAPFRFREMVARLGAVLRRRQSETLPKAAILRAGDLELDINQRRLRRAGRDVHLSRLEFDLLLFLMQNREVPLTHLRLLRGVWKKDFAYDPRWLRFYISLLREKIEDKPARPRYILTERWVGYSFHDPGTFQLSDLRTIGIRLSGQ